MLLTIGNDVAEDNDYVDNYYNYPLQSVTNKVEDVSKDWDYDTAIVNDIKRESARERENLVIWNKRRYNNDNKL